MIICQFQGTGKEREALDDGGAATFHEDDSMSRPSEVSAIAKSGLHHIEYRQNHKHGGLAGLGAAIAAVSAGLPHALAELAQADGQRLISLTAVDPSTVQRVRITDPAVSPPKFWPR